MRTPTEINTIWPVINKCWLPNLSSGVYSTEVSELEHYAKANQHPCLSDPWARPLDLKKARVEKCHAENEILSWRFTVNLNGEQIELVVFND